MALLSCSSKNPSTGGPKESRCPSYLKFRAWCGRMVLLYSDTAHGVAFPNELRLQLKNLSQNGYGRGSNNCSNPGEAVILTNTNPMMRDSYPAKPATHAATDEVSLMCGVSHDSKMPALDKALRTAAGYIIFASTLTRCHSRACSLILISLLQDNHRKASSPLMKMYEDKQHCDQYLSH